MTRKMGAAPIHDRSTDASLVAPFMQPASPMDGPGACVDCGTDAYIKLAGTDDEMICAHCYAARVRRDASAPRPPASEPQHETQRP